MCVEALAWYQLAQVSSHLLGSTSTSLRDRLLDLPAALPPMSSDVICVGRVVRSISQFDKRAPGSDHHQAERRYSTPPRAGR